jgi:PTH1 family peptidyl-tRNA hydrolase
VGNQHSPTSAHQPIQLIVGLANPGPKYALTRHNAGSWLVEALADRQGVTLTEATKFFGCIGCTELHGRTTRLFIPTTFINHSGRAVAAVANFYKIPPAAILVVHDELDIEPGTARLKRGGGHGGHNGLRDIIASLGSKQFCRLRIGIGHPGSADQVTPYVLGKASEHDQQQITKAIDEALNVLPEVMAGDWERAMNYLHSFRA